jgi:hypothetical protein
MKKPAKWKTAATPSELRDVEFLEREVAKTVAELSYLRVRLHKMRNRINMRHAYRVGIVGASRERRKARGKQLDLLEE